MNSILSPSPRIKVLMWANDTFGWSKARSIEFNLHTLCRNRPALYVVIAQQIINTVKVYSSDIGLQEPTFSKLNTKASKQLRRASKETIKVELAHDKLLQAIGGALQDCPRCGSALEFELKQLRSADEPMTVFFFCSKCSWKKKI